MPGVSMVGWAATLNTGEPLGVLTKVGKQEKAFQKRGGGVSEGMWSPVSMAPLEFTVVTRGSQGIGHCWTAAGGQQRSYGVYTHTALTSGG